MKNNINCPVRNIIWVENIFPVRFRVPSGTPHEKLSPYYVPDGTLFIGKYCFSTYIISLTGLVVLAYLFLSIFTGCNIINKDISSVEPIHINRFDKDLFQLIAIDTPELQEKTLTDYPAMLKVIGLSIFGTQNTQNADFFDRMLNYYSEPTLKHLYSDAIQKFSTIETIEASLGKGFHNLKTQFPTMQIPAVYIHVSGLKENVLVDDSLLSISIDKYMGADYPLYQDFFYAYQLRKMNPDYIVPDYLRAWLIAEFPFKGNDRILLERMIYEGKINYILHRTLPKVMPEILIGYHSSDYQWCKKNEKFVWNLIIERKHLFTPDAATTKRYFSDMPSVFIADDAPGNLGSWIGWQIVNQYMKKAKVSLEELMKNTDYQEILRISRYKP